MIFNRGMGVRFVVVLRAHLHGPAAAVCCQPSDGIYGELPTDE